MSLQKIRVEHGNPKTGYGIYYFKDSIFMAQIRFGYTFKKNGGWIVGFRTARNEGFREKKVSNPKKAEKAVIDKLGPINKKLTLTAEEIRDAFTSICPTRGRGLGFF